MCKPAKEMKDGRTLFLNSTLIILMVARFATAIARLAIGPLLPFLPFVEEADKSIILSSYSCGYLLCQIGGGVMAEAFGPMLVVGISVCVSAFLVFLLTCLESSWWKLIFFLLGIVSGPLFPAGNAALRRLPNPSAAATFVGAAASAGTTVASMSPLLAELFSWKFVYQSVSAILFAVGIHCLHETLSDEKDATRNQKVETRKRLIPVFKPQLISLFLCHSCDNFVKYSINAWAASMLSEQFDSKAATVAGILALQEGLGVATRLTSTLTPHLTRKTRGASSSIAFCWQGLTLYFAFIAPRVEYTACLLMLNSIGGGIHSIGYRAFYLEHSAVVSGVGNTMASLLGSTLGPALLGSLTSWPAVGAALLACNCFGSVAALFCAA